jgi:hypothetical protein
MGGASLSTRYSARFGSVVKVLGEEGEVDKAEVGGQPGLEMTIRYMVTI